MCIICTIIRLFISITHMLSKRSVVYVVYSCVLEPPSTSPWTQTKFTKQCLSLLVVPTKQSSIKVRHIFLAMKHCSVLTGLLFVWSANRTPNPRSEVFVLQFSTRICYIEGLDAHLTANVNHLRTYVKPETEDCLMLGSELPHVDLP